MDYEFEKWWKKCGRYEQEVIENPKLEEQFKSFGYRVYKQYEQNNEREKSRPIHTEYYE